MGWHFRKFYQLPLWSGELLCFFLLLIPAEMHGQFFKKALGLKNNSPSSSLALPVNSDILRNQIRSDYASLENSLYNNKGSDSFNILNAQNKIIDLFKSNGLLGFKNNFRQTFTYPSGKYVSMDSRLILDRNHLLIPQEALPLPYSDSGFINNYFLPNSRDFGQPWVIPLFDSREEALQPGIDISKTIYLKAKEAQKMGASAVIFCDTFGVNGMENTLTAKRFPTLAIPVLFVNRFAYQKKIQGFNVITPFYLKLNFRPSYKKGVNLIAGIDNHAPNDVIIFSHLHRKLMLERGNGRDGLSSIVTMMNLSRLLTKSGAKMNNYIFVVLDETKGDNGSKAFFNQPIIDWKKVSYIIDLDRLENSKADAALSVEGVTTSEAWLNLLSSDTTNRRLSFSKTTDSAGILSYFLKESIPGLRFSDFDSDISREATDMGSSLNAKSTENLLTILYYLIQQSEKALPLTFATYSKQKEISWRLEHPVQAQPAPAQTTNTTNRKSVSSKVPSPDIQKEHSTASKTDITQNGHSNQNVGGPAQSIEPKAKEQPIIPKENNTSAGTGNDLDSLHLYQNIGIEVDSTYKGFGARIRDILKYSSADRAGLKSGDIIMIIGRVKINNLKDYTIVMNGLKPGVNTVFRIKRDTDVMDLSLMNF